MADSRRPIAGGPPSDPGASDDGYITAREAARILDVKLPTLYAYVSRGLVRSLPASESRRRRYAREDVVRLRARADARRGHGAVAAGALRWGEPVLDSAITEILADGHRYRGHRAADLAREHCFEDVAELLWRSRPVVGEPSDTGERGCDPVTLPWRASADEETVRAVRSCLPDRAAAFDVLSLVVGLWSARHRPPRTDQPAATNAADRAELVEATRLMVTMAHALGEASELSVQGDSMAECLLAALTNRPGALRDPAIRRWQRRTIDGVLVLMADHELNASSFAARVAASVGATLPACVSAGLATVSGARHGGACDRIEAFVGAHRSAAMVERAVTERLAAGASVTGFGHPLYPAGDPRARVLLAWAEDARQNGWSGAHSATRMAKGGRALIAAMAANEREPPTCDVGLVVLCATLGLRSGSASALFALARTAGFIAHALEQRESGFQVRPRARYIGPREP